MSDASLYDEVPYPGNAFPQTHPDRLGTMATLFGVEAAPPRACRVLELGCADGGNLLPMAFTLPGSTFVGIDSSTRAIAIAKQLNAELGLRNLRFELLGIEDYEPEPASFDYVIAHGIYSWVPASVRDSLLEVIARALAPDGVAYVSYNSLPGHRTRQTLRDLLAYALEGVDEPQQRMAAARGLLEQACEVWTAGEGLETTIGGQARMLLAHGDALFFHDTLSPSNKAVYLHEFATHAGQHGLQFMAEAEFSEMQIGGLPQEMQQALLAIDDIVRREQLLDFLKQRMFRQTLLCHDALQLAPRPQSARVASLCAAGSMEVETDPDSDRVTFRSSAGSHVSTDHPVLVEALTRIAEAWPAAVSVAELAADEEHADVRREVICDALIPCFAANLLRLQMQPPPLTKTPGERPRTSPVARLQARERERVTTLRHTSIRLEDDLGWLLVALLDGTRDRAALLAELDRITEGSYPNLARDLERSLTTLGSVGLLMAET